MSDDEMEKELRRQHLNRLRAQVKQMLDENDQENQTWLDDQGIALKPGHINQLKELSRKLNLPYFLAAKELRRQIKHDDLDFTLPFEGTIRLKKIVLLVNRISIGKKWEYEYQNLLEDGNEELLLTTLERISWEAFDANKTLSSYCEDIQQLQLKKVNSEGS